MIPGENQTTAGSGAGIEIVSMPAELDLTTRRSRSGPRALPGLFASPVSGTSMNPGRTLGPDIAGHDYTG